MQWDVKSLSSSMWNMYFALRILLTSVAFYLRSLFWLEVCNLNSDIYCIMYILLHSTLIGATAILKTRVCCCKYLMICVTSIVQQHKQWTNRLQISWDILQVVILYSRKTCFTGLLYLFCFFVCFAFPSLWEWTETLGS